jgi:hypothetical protein
MWTVISLYPANAIIDPMKQNTLIGLAMIVFVGALPSLMIFKTSATDRPVAAAAASAPNFTLSVSPSTRAVPTGQFETTYSEAVVKATNGFEGSVKLSAGSPCGTEGIVCIFAPTSLFLSPSRPIGASEIKVYTTPNAHAGTYPIQITAADGGLIRSAPFTLQITPPTNFSISTDPTSLTMNHAGSSSSLVAVKILTGPSSYVGLEIAGVPAGTSVSFNPVSVLGTGTSTLVIRGSASAKPGTYTLTIYGVDSSYAHPANLRLVLQ